MLGTPADAIRVYVPISLELVVIAFIYCCASVMWCLLRQYLIDCINDRFLVDYIAITGMSVFVMAALTVLRQRSMIRRYTGRP